MKYTRYIEMIKRNKRTIFIATCIVVMFINLIIFLSILSHKSSSQELKKYAKLNTLKHLSGKDLTADMDVSHAGPINNLRYMYFKDTTNGNVLIIHEYRVSVGSVYYTDKEYKQLSYNLDRLYRDNTDSIRELRIIDIIIECGDLRINLKPKYYEYSRNEVGINDYKYKYGEPTLLLEAENTSIWNIDTKALMSDLLRYKAKYPDEDINVELVMGNDILRCTFNKVTYNDYI